MLAMEVDGVLHGVHGMQVVLYGDLGIEARVSVLKIVAGQCFNRSYCLIPSSAWLILLAL